MKRALVAVGGNALAPNRERGSIADQLVASQRVAESVIRMLSDGWSVVLTHGNGPQVGFILRRSELAAGLTDDIPRIGLEIAGADSQGGIGHLLAIALSNSLRKRSMPNQVVAMITHTLVQASDPGFKDPSKPIGTWYSKEQADTLGREEGWVMVEDSGRGWRRLVASPQPVRVLESAAVRCLLENHFVVVAAGGGGIPVVDDGGAYRGVEAVIDKDLVAADLAVDLKADLLVLTTGVDQIAIDFGTQSQRWLSRISALQAEQYAAEGQFPPGSMGPKIAAALDFLRRSQGQVLVTSPDALPAALDGAGGTWIFGDRLPSR